MKKTNLRNAELFPAIITPKTPTLVSFSFLPSPSRQTLNGENHIKADYFTRNLWSPTSVYDHFNSHLQPLPLLHKNLPQPSSDHIPSLPSQRKEKPSDIDFSPLQCKHLNLPYHFVFPPILCYNIDVLSPVEGQSLHQSFGLHPLSPFQELHIFIIHSLSSELNFSPKDSRILTYSILFLLREKEKATSPSPPYHYPTTSLSSSPSQPNCLSSLALFPHLLLPAQPTPLWILTSFSNSSN